MSWINLKIKATKKRATFLRLLTRDLRRISFPVRLTKTSDGLLFSFRPGAASRDSFAFLRRLHRASLWRERGVIRALEQQVRPSLAFAAAKEVQVERIQPQLRVCRSKDELALFDYLRRYQTVASNPCVGATLKAIIHDEGQDAGTRLLGILALSSAQYFQGARDQHLGWHNPSKGRKAKRLREKGLKRCLQVATCMAIPPYDVLRCGRLVAMMCFSTELQEAFSERYGYGYLALTAGASMQNYSVVYDRLHLKDLIDSPTKAHLYYKLRCGKDTYRYLTGALSEATISAARQLTLHAVASSRSQGQDDMKILRRAMKACGVPFEILQTNRTATYLGAVSTECIECLRSGQDETHVASIDSARILAYWRSRFAEGAARSLQNSSDGSAVLLSKQLRRPWAERARI